MQPHAIPAEPVKAIPIDMSSVVTHDVHGVVIREGGLLLPGIYFGLSSEQYHADPALGSTNLKDLLRHHMEYYHNSPLNPNRVDTDSLARMKGRALHTLSLEGREVYDKRYAIPPRIEDWAVDGKRPLQTVEDLAGVLKKLGLPHTGKKADLVKRVLEAEPDQIIWDNVIETFNAMVARDGKEVLKPEIHDEVVRAAASITSNPHLVNVFRGGVAEVSVIWIDEHGLRCKCRFDMLKPRAIIDLKKVSNSRGLPFDMACGQAIGNYRYDIQASHYYDGYRALYSHAREGRIFGDCPLPDGWQNRMAMPHDMIFIWIFHQMEGAAISIGRSITPDSPLLMRAERDKGTAKRTFIECRDRFGEDPWISDDPVLELASENVSGWMREYAEEYV